MRKHVILLMESSLAVSRQIIAGIFEYIQGHDPWILDFMPGGIGDQHLPPGWSGDGIIARIPSTAEARRIAAHPAPKVLLDPQDQFIRPNRPLARCARIENDHLAVGRQAADYFLARGFTSFAFAGATLSSSCQMFYDLSNTREPHWSRLRREGFVGRLAEEGRSVFVYDRPTALRTASNWCFERKRMIGWLSALPKQTAVFAPHDSRARQVADACLAANIYVPYHIAILGVNDDRSLCETAIPPTSSIPIAARQAGYVAAETLSRLMSGERKSGRVLAYPPLETVSRDSTLTAQTNDDLVISAMETIRLARGFNLRASELATRMQTSLRTLEQHFSRELGKRVVDVIREQCLDNVAELVRNSELSFSAITKLSGQLSQAHLAHSFRQRFGQTMGEYRKNQS